MVATKKITSIASILFLLIITEISLLLDDSMDIGELISYIFPCETPSMNSFPCYGFYSIYLFIGNGIIILGLIGYIVDIYVSKNKEHKNIIHKITNIFGYAIMVCFIIIVCWMIFGSIFLR